MLMHIADVKIKGFLLRQNGKRLREALTKGHSHGAINSARTKQTHPSTGERIQCLSGALKMARALMVYMTWLEMYGNGQQTGLSRIRAIPIPMKTTEKNTGW